VISRTSRRCGRAGARTLVIAEDGDTRGGAVRRDGQSRVPRTPTLLAPLVAVVPLQILFACALGHREGTRRDQPRNLAKSVTVE
jgi:glucosamine--fructose-6-phosphate aminotransferase (isomerizing)